MKLLIQTLAAGVACAALWAGTATAATPEELLKADGCTACHAVGNKLVGPAYKDVAKKYAGDKNAQAKLVDKVRKGGSGVWGPIPMPPHPQIKDADLQAMVKYVLSLK